MKTHDFYTDYILLNDYIDDAAGYEEELSTVCSSKVTFITVKNNLTGIIACSKGYGCM